jgi:glycosyltransferase involved in cell wall biosynthesis
MNIIWMTWKDKSHPQAGGAEILNEALAERLVSDGHSVRLLVGSYRGAKKAQFIKGYEVIRLGNRWSVYYHVWRYYKKHNLDSWADIVIDEVNTVPFFAKFYTKKTTYLFVHMLCRKIWFYEMPFPLSLIGYLTEPIYLRMLRHQQVITVSKSTEQDLMRNGFKRSNIHIISEGIDVPPVTSLNKVSKFETKTVLAMGSVRSMKRTLHQVKVFEIVKQTIPNIQMIIAGKTSGKYTEKVKKRIASSPFRKDIVYQGDISQREKIRLLQCSHIFMATSVKEGWCLVVSEAASQGTPAIVYDVDGLRDSVTNNETGLIVADSSPKHMADGLVKLLTDRSLYKLVQQNAWQRSKILTFENAYLDFKGVISL